MTKKSWIALVIAFAMLISCFAVLAQTAGETAGAETQAAEEVTQATAEDAQAPAEDAQAPAEEKQPVDINALSDDAVLMTVNGEAITKGDMSVLYDQMMQQYAAYGMDFTSTENQQALMSYVLNMLLQEKLIMQQGVKLGFDQFTEAELAAFKESAQQSYDSALNTYKGYYAAEGKTDEEVEAEVIAFLDQNNYTPDAIAENLKKNEIYNKVYAEATKDVNVSEDDVKKVYGEKVEAAKAAYAAAPAQYTTDVAGGATIYYTPEGNRTVKHILVKFDEAGQLKTLEEELAAMAEDDAAREETEKKIAEITGKLQPKLDEIQSKIDAGEDFNALIDQYGEDGGMKNGATAETGYTMNAATTSFVPEFTAAGMALNKVGDISKPTLSTYGYHIIRYNGDVPAGETPYETVKDALTQTLKDEAVKAAYSAALNEWASASAISYEFMGQ